MATPANRIATDGLNLYVKDHAKEIMASLKDNLREGRENPMQRVGDARAALYLRHVDKALFDKLMEE